MNHKLISKRVKEIRTEILKMSQSEFINALGLKSKSAVSMWENEEIDNKMIHIDRTINYHAYTPTGQKNSKDLIGKTKTYDSVRSITISDRLVSVLKTFKTYQNECKLKLGARYDKTYDFVFTTTGKPYQNQH
ncbi:transcriptional regulator [Bacillus phage PfEFR-5]|uniref:Transcriptional regulator n=1 Tax=Bacillus phage PfEFR-5 TaxID=1868599 RepID=A0A1B1P8I1_9CAUD|nr:transcriptional regulator [Bacillus phage PfEFR-5]ANT40401.1 transcriptional regulator [Bacillus phage PfEFR-5]